MKVRAALLRSPRSTFEIVSLELAEPKAGEVRIKVAAAGICHSDWHVVTGDTKHPLPAVLGHEASGVVDALGPEVTTLKRGDHVALTWAPSCGECFYCELGQFNLCEAYTDSIWAGTMRDGSVRLTLDSSPVYHYCGLACFAEFAVVPVNACVAMPQGLPHTLAALIGCAVTTGVGSVLSTGKVTHGSSVAILGAGGVGLSTVMGARLAGATTIIAIDPIPARLIAAKDVGATHLFEPGPQTESEVKAATGGRGADFVFEAVGLPSVQESCLSFVRSGGTVVLSGLSPMGSKTNFPGAVLTRREITVKGSYYGSANPPVDFVNYAELCRTGALPLEKLLTRTYRLEQINEAFADMLSGETRRGVVTFD